MDEFMSPDEMKAKIAEQKEALRTAFADIANNLIQVAWIQSADDKYLVESGDNNLIKGSCFRNRPEYECKGHKLIIANLYCLVGLFDAVVITKLFDGTFLNGRNVPDIVAKWKIGIPLTAPVVTMTDKKELIIRGGHHRLCIALAIGEKNISLIVPEAQESIILSLLKLENRVIN